MATSFAEFIAWPDREEIVLVNVRAMLTLTGWTAVGGGSPNTYQVSVPNRTTPPAGHEAMYRRVIGVRENGTDLTGQSSLANVNANAGSYFWDEATGLLYVRTTGTAVDPDTKTLMAARVQFFHATTSIVLNATDGNADTGRFYEGAVSAQTGIVASQQITELFAGRSVTMGGELVLANGHKGWLHLVAPDSGYTFKHQQVLFRFGGRYRGETMPLSQFTTIGTMLVEDITAGETDCRIALKPVGRAWTEITVPVTPYFETEYPNLGDGVRGTYKAILYGRAWTAPALTSTLGFGVWTVADAAYQTLAAVHNVEAISRSGNVRAVLTEGQDYTVNLTTCTVTVVTERFSHVDWQIRVEATGQPTKHANAGGAAGMRGYLSTASEIARDMLHRFAGLPASALDTSAFDEAHLDALDELAVYLPTPRTLGSIFSTAENGQPSIERSVRALIGQTLGGLITMRVWDPTYDAATLPVLTKQDLAAFSPAPRLETLTTIARVWYGFDGRFDTWSKADAVDQVQQYLTGVTTALELWTFLRSTSDADVLAARYQYAERWSTIDVDFVERGTLLALTDVGQRVLVTYDPAPDTSGAWTDRAFVLTRTERGYAPRMTVQGTLRDAGRLLNRVGRWKGPSEPNYASASAAQRLLSGYWGAASSPSSTLGWH